MVVSVPLALGSSEAVAQAETTQLNVTTNTITFDPPTADDYATGFVTGVAGITFTVSVAGGQRSRTATVSIRGTDPSIGGGKPLSDVQWRRADLPTWTSLTLTNVNVEGRSMNSNTNNPWTNGILFRLLLNWGSDPPANYQANVEITLTQTVP
jgi:hypothetical protein